jgi:hypothetical protein
MAVSDPSIDHQLKEMIDIGEIVYELEEMM